MSYTASEKDTNYQRQLENIFDRPTDKPLWNWYPVYIVGLFDAHTNTVFDFIERLMQNLKTDLAPYNTEQIAGGIAYIFNNTQSDFTHDFKNADVTPARRARVLLSMFNLWRDIFNSMCEPKTSMGEQTIISELNNTCYMFWDTTPLSTWIDKTNEPVSATDYLNTFSDADLNNLGLPDDILKLMLQSRSIANNNATPQKTLEEISAEMQNQLTDVNAENKGYYKAIAQVMKQSLYLSNPACVESGLHGLGHMVFSQPNIAEPIIEEFLKNSKTGNKHLIEYARAARTGMIL